ncbi:MAG: DUF72 domain-containing protein [Actinobacteria bacterium]|nr:MAG: DUF72 domain-containing protein [Actinomycetota bacterium]
MGDVVVGTCSWTDKTMVEAYYPRGVSTPEARLRYYAERFDTVEVDSSFYALPTAANARRWAERTPPGFTFHVKAFGLMTRHTVDERVLPAELREHEYDLTDRGRVTRPSPEMVERSFELFREALTPLSDAGKMGGVLMQFPPFFEATGHRRTMEHLGYLEYAREQLAGLPVFVEFRHPSWAADRLLPEVLAFLSEREMSFVAVDAPQLPSRTTMPPVTAVTAPWSYVRFHGRNAATWHARTASAADRFDYLYTPEELAEWEQPIRDLARDSERTWAMFNNCKRDFAPRNARDLALVLADVVAPRAGGALTGDPAHPVDRGPHPGPGQLDLGL